MRYLLLLGLCLPNCLMATSYTVKSGGGGSYTTIHRRYRQCDDCGYKRGGDSGNRGEHGDNRESGGSSHARDRQRRGR